jgi:hypothetical protein
MKVYLSGIVPSCCISQESCITFSGCPAFAHLKSFYSMQKCSIALCLVPLQPALLPPMVGFIGLQASVLLVSSYV